MILQLNASQVAKIKSQLPVFKTVEDATGVPWEMVAACWFRESLSVTPPKTPGGPFQFDPAPSESTIRMLLENYCVKEVTQELKDHIVEAGVNVFESAALLCACWLRHKVKPVITPDAPDDVVKDAFWGYNGRAYGSADKSPYVMNGYSSRHMGPDGRGMVLRGSIPDGHGGRRQIVTTDGRPGAFTVYKQLKALNL